MFNSNNIIHSCGLYFALLRKYLRAWALSKWFGVRGGVAAWGHKIAFSWQNG